MITEENYLTATFIDSERKNIEVLLKSDDGKAVNPFILEYDPNNSICKELLSVVTSVSYTHLRAHETPEHRVIRLVR